MVEALTVPTIANFDHFKGQNKHFAHWSIVIMIFGDVFIAQPRQKVDRDLLKNFLDFKIGISWIGEALTVPSIANFDHFKGQNTHIAHWSTVFMLSDDVLYPKLGKKLAGTCLNTFWTSKLCFLGWVRP